MTRMKEDMKAQTPNDLKPWHFASETMLIPDEQYTDLEVIDLSTFKLEDFTTSSASSRSPEENRVHSDLVARTLNAFRTTGFLAVKGHGLAAEDIHHQFSLGKLLVDNVSEEEKHRLLARISEEGSWAGYKPQGYYRRPDGAKDSIEYYDFYPYTARQSSLPTVAHTYVDDFREFIEYNHYVVLRKILALISLGLGLEVDTLWHLHHRGGYANDGALRGGPDEAIEWKHSKDHLRYAMYHPPSEEDREKKKHLWLPGHTDLGSVSFLYSQPIAGLQILMENGEWRYIRHYPNHIVVDLGDSMEFMTGGVLKASPHRVLEPPDDQRHLDRLGIFYFVPFLAEVKLTVLDYPSLRALGAKDVFEEYYQLGGEPLTSNEWLVLKSKLVGTKRVKREKREAVDVLEDIHFRYNN